MQMYWLSHNRAPWNERNLSRKFSGTIYTNEARTSELDLSDKEVKVLIRIDFPVIELMSKPITITIGNILEFMFTENEMPEKGEWKIELLVLKDGETIGITHHEDFDVR